MCNTSLNCTTDIAMIWQNSWEIEENKQNSPPEWAHTAWAKWTFDLLVRSAMMVCLFLQTRQYFIYWYGLFGVIEYEGNRWNLPAGWLAVGPSRFHVMFGFGEPFLEQASERANDQPSKPNRQQRNESELHGTAAAAHVKKEI